MKALNSHDLSKAIFKLVKNVVFLQGEKTKTIYLENIDSQRPKGAKKESECLSNQI